MLCRGRGDTEGGCRLKEVSGTAFRGTGSPLRQGPGGNLLFVTE